MGERKDDMGKKKVEPLYRFREARPVFICDLKDKMFWLSDAQNRVVVEFADKSAVTRLYRQIKSQMGLK